MRQTQPSARRPKPVPVPVVEHKIIDLDNKTVKVIRISPKGVAVVYK